MKVGFRARVIWLIINSISSCEVIIIDLDFLIEKAIIINVNSYRKREKKKSSLYRTGN